MRKSDLVVKTNQLNTVLQNLTLAEIRIIQLAIVDARETNRGLSADTPLYINATRYAEAFNTTPQNAYGIMKEAEAKLFDRQFTYLTDVGQARRTRWIQDATYIKGEGTIEIAFTRSVVEQISRIDGAENFFTSYLLSQTASMNSCYSVRLYELLIQWQTVGKTPTFDLEIFRGQLGLEDNEYSRMYDFKKRVLDLGVNEINKKSDITVSYKPVKKGTTITGFNFTIKTKEKSKTLKDVQSDKPINMTAKQVSTYSKRLAALPELGSQAPIGASIDSYASMIANDLVDSVKIKKYTKYLDKVGFKAS